MSTQPEEIVNEIIEEDETEDEIEEGEIVTEDEDEDELEDFENEELDVQTLMTSLLATEEGDTICTALVDIGQQIQVQNKILIKILAQLKN